MAPARSKQQYRFFKYLEANPEKAKEKGLSEAQVKDFTSMTKDRFKKLKEKIKK